MSKKAEAGQLTIFIQKTKLSKDGMERNVKLIIVKGRVFCKCWSPCLMTSFSLSLSFRKLKEKKIYYP